MVSTEKYFTNKFFIKCHIAFILDNFLQYFCNVEVKIDGLTYNIQNNKNAGRYFLKGKLN